MITEDELVNKLANLKLKKEKLKNLSHQYISTCQQIELLKNLTVEKETELNKVFTTERKIEREIEELEEFLNDYPKHLAMANEWE